MLSVIFREHRRPHTNPSFCAFVSFSALLSDTLRPLSGMDTIGYSVCIRTTATHLCQSLVINLCGDTKWRRRDDRREVVLEHGKACWLTRQVNQDPLLKSTQHCMVQFPGDKEHFNRNTLHVFKVLRFQPSSFHQTNVSTTVL